MADERVKFSLTADDQTRSAFASVKSNIEGVAKSLRSISTIGGGVIGAVALGEVRQMGAALLDARIKAEKLGNTLSQAVGSSGVRSELSFLRTEANRLGLQFGSTAQSYAKFAAASRGTALEGAATRDIFTSIAQASTVLGLSAEETTGALNAIQQMISKGTVQSEELRGQLGERLPGAFQIAARSIGVTTAELSKMLEQGEVISADFLPKFARQLQVEFAGSVSQAANSTQASVNRLSTAWEELKRTLGEGVAGEALKAGIEKTTGAIDNLEKATKRAEQSSGTWLENLRELLVLLPGPGGRVLEALAGQQPAAERRAMASGTQDEILGRRARERGPGVTADTITGLRRTDIGQMGGIDAKAREDVRKLLEQYRSPGQRDTDTINELRRLGGLTGQDVSGAIAEVRRRSGGDESAAKEAERAAEGLIKQLYAEQNLTATQKAALETRLRSVKLTGEQGEAAARQIDVLDREKKSREAASESLKDYIELQGQIAGNEREGAEKALTPDMSGWQRVADVLREIRKIDPSSKTRDGALDSANKLLDSGAIDFTEYEKLGAKILELKDPIAEVANSTKEIFAPIESAFENALLDGEKLSDVFSGLARDMARIALRQQITGPAAEYFGALTSGKSTAGIGTGTIFSGLLALIGARANGGPISAGMPYLVGERGAELVVPRAAGTVIPAGKFGGGTTIQQTFVIRDSADIGTTVRKAAAMGAKQAQAEIMDSRQRGGAFA